MSWSTFNRSPGRAYAENSSSSLPLDEHESFDLSSLVQASDSSPGIPPLAPLVVAGAYLSSLGHLSQFGLRTHFLRTPSKSLLSAWAKKSSPLSLSVKSYHLAHLTTSTSSKCSALSSFSTSPLSRRLMISRVASMRDESSSFEEDMAPRCAVLIARSLDRTEKARTLRLFAFDDRRYQSKAPPLPFL